MTLALHPPADSLQVIRFPRRRGRRSPAAVQPHDAPATLAYPRIEPDRCYYVDLFGVRNSVLELWTNDAWWALGQGEREELAPTLYVLGEAGYFRKRSIPRPEALADDPTPQPTPIKVDLSGKTLVRDWKRSDVAHCRLCSTCTAFPRAKTRPDEATCCVATERLVTHAEAPLYSEFDCSNAGGAR